VGAIPLAPAARLIRIYDDLCQYRKSHSNAGDINSHCHRRDKVYDGASTAAVVLSDNRIEGDVFTDSSISATFANASTGNGKTITVNGISISGPNAGNYTLANTTAKTTANILDNSLLTESQLIGIILKDLLPGAGGALQGHLIGAGSGGTSFFFYHP